MNELTRAVYSVSRFNSMGTVTLFGAGMSTLFAGMTNAQNITFEKSAYYITFYQNFSVTNADLNGDAYIDILRSEEHGDITKKGITYFRNLGDGTFIDEVVTTIACENAHLLTAGDFDGDHDVDLAWYNNPVSGGTFLEVFTNDGTGKNGSLKSYDVPSQPSNIRFCDVDYDKDLDLVVEFKNNEGNTFTIYKNHKGIFSRGNIYNSGGINYHHDMVMGDIDRDGDVDIATLDVDGFYVNSYEKGRYYNVYDSQVSFFMNDGKGNFTLSHSEPLPYNNDTKIMPYSLAMGDLDGDADLDLTIVADNTSGSSYHYGEIIALINNGDGSSFATLPIMQYDSYNSDNDVIELADFDCDGDLDILVDYGISSKNPLVVLVNDGELNFNLGNHIYTGYSSVASVAINDLNGDGLPDLTIDHYSGITIMMNTTVYDGITLSHDPLIRGETSTFTIESGGLYEKVYLYYSKNGYGNSAGKIFFGGMTMDLADPIIQAATGFTNENGIAHIDLPVPDNAPLMNVTFQAAIQRGIGDKDSVKTPISITRIQ